MRTRDSRRLIYSGWILAVAILCGATLVVRTQTPAAENPTSSQAPAWAQPGSATHTQVAPPPDFHRPSRNFDIPLGVFEGQSDIGSALVPGSASYDAAGGNYTIISGEKNIWYTGDEFGFLWGRMWGVFSLA